MTDTPWSEPPRRKPDETERDRADGNGKQNVEDRPNVGTVTPEDYLRSVSTGRYDRIRPDSVNGSNGLTITPTIPFDCLVMASGAGAHVTRMIAGGGWIASARMRRARSPLSGDAVSESITIATGR